MKTEQRNRIAEHGRKLLAIFPDATETDPVNLCRKLRRIENAASHDAVQECNVGMPESWRDRHLNRLNRLLGNDDGKVPTFINGDPRGYALKIDDEWMKANDADLHRDWGGYGIIAPEID